MRRREFFAVLGRTAAALGGTIAVRPFEASAQQRLRRIGLLMVPSRNDPASRNYLTALKEALHDLGWIEGINMGLEIKGQSQNFESEGREFEYFRGRQEKSKPWLNMFLLMSTRNCSGITMG